MEIQHILIIISHSIEEGSHLIFIFYGMVKIFFSVPLNIAKKQIYFFQATVVGHNEMKLLFFFLTMIVLTAETQPHWCSG